MTTLRVHFDGRVLVPEGPVDLPRGKVFDVRLEEVQGGDRDKSDSPVFELNELTGLPVVKVRAGAKPITLEDVRRAEDEW